MKYVSFFLRFLSRPERSTGWADMQSVHAGAVQTHFSTFAFFLKSSFQKTSFGLHFGDIFTKNYKFGVEKGFQKSLPKNGIPQSQISSY